VLHLIEGVTVRRSPALVARLGLAGATALSLGSMMLVGVAVQSLRSTAFADASAFELFCRNTPIGNIAFNDVAISATLSPAAPGVGQSFDVDGFQAQVPVPSEIAQQAAAIGNTGLGGSLTTKLTASGATPTTLSTGSLAFDGTIPSPIPASGFTLQVPETPTNFGPFTATSSNVAISIPSTIQVVFDDAGIVITLNCAAYPNDSLPSGLTQQTPPGLPIAPVVAFAGEPPSPAPPNAVTGPYELYCPHTPVGDLVFNDVTTTATMPSDLSAGQQFSLTNYQTTIPLPSGVVESAAGLGNASFDGLAAGAVDAYGASPLQVATGSLSFDVPIPDPVPSSGLTIELPGTPTTVGPFTATGGPITVAADQTISVVAALSSKAFTMTCTSYPNDSVATSGSTGVAPSGTPILPVVASSTASGTSTPSTPPTTVPSPFGGIPTSTGPYELYCPGSPVGNLVVNDVTTSAAISPASPPQGQSFTLTGLQTQFSLPQGIAQEAENLGITKISGDESMFLNTSGAVQNDFGYVSTTTLSTGTVVEAVSSASGSAGGVAAPTTVPISPPILPEPPFPGYPGNADMPFSVTLPNPVPAAGVTFDAPAAPVTVGPFTALGGPIAIGVDEVNLNVDEFGDQFGLFCTAYPNDAEPTGLATHPPTTVSPVEPLIATGTSPLPPPPPPGSGESGPYELYCPGTPVGNIVLNNVTTSGTLSPADPVSGQQFSLTGYQTQVSIPSSIASAAAALGNPGLTGTATATVEAVGATPTSITEGDLGFAAPIPQPVPLSGVALTVPSAPITVGPFTATGDPVTLAVGPQTGLSLEVSGSALDLTCTAYPNDSAPSGISALPPPTEPTSPVIATTAPPGSSPVGAITEAYNTLFDLADPSLADKVAVVQDGASIEEGLSQAMSSSLASSASGATVDSVQVLADSTCAADGLPSPCAVVVYDIVGPQGSALLPDQHGYAVEVDGTWLVATTTMCGLLELFYEASGMPGPPPGCPASTTVPTTPGSPLTVPPVPTTIIGPAPTTSAGSSPPPAPGGSESAPTGTEPVTIPPAPSTTGPSTTEASSTSGSSSTVAPAAPTEPTATSAPAGGPSTTAGPATAAGGNSTTTAPPGPGSAAGTGTPKDGSDPSPGIVTAPSSSLAFTGPGGTMHLVALLGALLVAVGLALLVLVDAPRRAWARLAPAARLPAPTAGGPTGPEGLWALPRPGATPGGRSPG